MDLWKTVTFNDIAAKSKYPIGDGDHGAIKPSTYGLTGVPYIRVGDLVDGQISLKSMVYIPTEVHEANPKSHLKTGDILIAKTGATIGKVAIIPASIPEANTTSSIGKVSLNPEIADARYVYRYMATKQFQDQMWRVSIKSAQPGFNIRDLKGFTLPLPPLSEQRRIAAILDQADALRAKRREALAQLDSLTQSIFIEMFGDPATNPKGFPARTLGEIIKFEGGSQPPASTFSSEDSPDRIRLVQIRDFKSDRFKTYIPRKLCKRFFEEDDVMIGRYGPPVFQILRGLAGSYNVALMKAVPRDGVTKDFVFHLLKEERLHNFVVANSERTAGQSGVNLGLLENYQAYLPPEELQIQFSEMMSHLKDMTISMTKAQSVSDSLFSSLQHRAFRGEL